MKTFKKITIEDINKKNLPKNVEYQLFSDSIFKDCFICFTGKENCLPLHSFGPSVRPTYLIHYIISGKGIFIYNGKEYSLHSSHAFFIEPDIMTYYQADQENPWTYIWFGLRGNNVENLFRRIGISKDKPIVFFEDKKRIEAIFKKVIQTNSGGIEQEFIRQSLMYEFLSCMSSKSELNIKITSSDDLIKSNYIIKAVEFIQNNFFNKIKVSDVAIHVGISRNYLFTLFKIIMGHSPSEYIMHFRLSRACNMLDDSSLSIENIAVYCGFEDAGYFSKSFKKQFFLSPSNYRKLKAQRNDLSSLEFLRYIKNLKSDKINKKL